MASEITKNSFIYDLSRSFNTVIMFYLPEEHSWFKHFSVVIHNKFLPLNIIKNENYFVISRQNN